MATLTTPARSHRQQPLVFGGVAEADAWAAAPLVLRSRVHFRVEVGHLDLQEFRAALPAGSEVTLDEGEGLYRVECDHGAGSEVRDLIRAWCAERGIVPHSLRPEKDVRRRYVRDLDPDFLSEFCVHYARYSQGRLNKHRSTLQFHFTDKDDEQQQIFEWVLDAASRYDETSGVPFGAFLSTRLSQWVHDLNRSKWGRAVTDAELKHQRARQQFVNEHGRAPSEAELAASLQQDLGTFRSNAQVVHTIQGLRNMGTLDAIDTEIEVPLPDEAMAEDRIMEEATQSWAAQVLTSACAPDPGARGKLQKRPNVLGWVAWYETTFGGMTKTELAAQLSTSMRNMNQYQDAAAVRMTAHRGDLDR